MIQPLKRMGLALLPLFLGSAILASLQGIVFRDKAGNMSLENMKSWKGTKVDDNTMSFVGAGNPLRGQWKDQGLSLQQAIRIEGTAVRAKGNVFRLEQASMSGSVIAVLRQQGSGGERTTTLKAESIVYTAEPSKAVITGGVDLKIHSPGISQTFNITGSSAVLDLVPLGEKASFPLSSGTIQGPVRFRLDGERKAAKGTSTAVVVTGNAAKLTYDDASLTMTLTGGVHLEGDDAVIGGTVDASKAVIRLNDKHEVIEVSFEGSPGKSTLRETGGQ